MRAIWTGAVAFGLVNVPVKVYAATEDHDVPLHQVHDADGGRIRYERRCEVCGEKVAFENIAKAYSAGDRTVILREEDFAALPAERSREIEVVQFVPRDQIEPIMLDSAYYLEPDSKSPKAYHLLRETLRTTDRVAVVQFALRRKTRLAVLLVRGDVLVLQTLRWADEIREAQFPAATADVKVSTQELAMAAALVEQYSGDFHPEAYEDEYQRELRILIEEKLRTGDAVDTEATFGPTGPAAGGDVVDLMEALRRSLEIRRAAAAQPDTPAEPPGRRKKGA